MRGAVDDGPDDAVAPTSALVRALAGGGWVAAGGGALMSLSQVGGAVALVFVFVSGTPVARASRRRTANGLVNTHWRTGTSGRT
jgi:hypothetical protein